MIIHPLKHHYSRTLSEPPQTCSCSTLPHAYCTLIITCTTYLKEKTLQTKKGIGSIHSLEHCAQDVEDHA